VICSSCESLLQPSAVSCINVGCAAYGVPLTSQERHANRSRPATPTAPMRPLRRLATAVCACATFVGLAMAFMIPVGMLTGDATPAWTFSELFTIAVALVGGGCFVVWLYRARRNLDALPGTDPLWSTSWTIGSWFVPIANLVQPGLVVSDVAKETVPVSDERDRRRIVTLARAWWIVSIVAILMLGELADTTRSHGPLVIYLTAGLVLAGAAGCVRLVREVSAAQLRRFEPLPDHASTGS
jgi:hypothetical protein